MACKNAENALHEKFELIKKDEDRTIGANESLREILHLKKLHRIELFDNSNLFGSYNVSGMVVFKDGKPNIKKIDIPLTNILSAIGSKNFPKLVTIFLLLAMCPSK